MPSRCTLLTDTTARLVPSCRGGFRAVYTLGTWVNVEFLFGIFMSLCAILFSGQYMCHTSLLTQILANSEQVLGGKFAQLQAQRYKTPSRTVRICIPYESDLKAITEHTRSTRAGAICHFESLPFSSGSQLLHFPRSTSAAYIWDGEEISQITPFDSGWGHSTENGAHFPPQGPPASEEIRWSPKLKRNACIRYTTRLHLTIQNLTVLEMAARAMGCMD
ncbi:hypothetical protein DFH06DRAFT_1139410 [Mycena polygramma]|nr:hypothetical protein DFH06DRAFT_1139410 [Mycena polygramma]